MALTRICVFCREPAAECICDIEAPAATPPAFDCRTCQDTGHVCENHPGRAWGALCCKGPVRLPVAPGTEVLCGHGACHCGGAGEPCHACCSPLPADGTRSIAEAFTPDWPGRQPPPPFFTVERGT